MRAPRYRFPDEVRSITRTMASQMVRDGAIPETPEQLDAWLAQAPDARQSLERGGYGTAFTARDLFPLLRVFLTQAGAPAPAAAEARPQPSTPRWVVALLVGLAVVLLAIALATGLFR
jgi:hypothetical protein